MNKYRKINVDLNRQYRDDLNWNFGQISDDMASVGREIDRVEKDLNNTIEGIVGGGFIESLETARDAANEAATNANSKANYADGRGKYANTQGDYAKEQGDYAKLKGDYADEKAILADEAAANANAEASNLDGLKVNVVDATQSANTAASNAVNATADAEQATTDAETATSAANTAAEKANDASDLANEKANLAQTRVDELNNLDTSVNKAIDKAETATQSANDAADNADEKAILADEKAQLAETSALHAAEKAQLADGAAEYANAQGGRAEVAADAIDDLLDEGAVVSVNGKTGIVNLTANDVDAETPIGAQEKADAALKDAKKYADDLEPDLTGYATETYVENKVNEIDLSPYAKSEDLQSLLEKDGKAVDSARLDGKTLAEVRAGTTKDDVGLSNVVNVKQASEQDFEDHKDKIGTEDDFGHVKADGKTIVSNDGVISALIPPKIKWFFSDGKTFDVVSSWYVGYINPSGGQATIEDDRLLFVGRGVNEVRVRAMTNMIDIGKFDYIKFEVKADIGNEDSYIQLTVHDLKQNSTALGTVGLRTSESIDKKIISLDVRDLKGEYRISMLVRNRRAEDEDTETVLEVYSIWGE